MTALSKFIAQAGISSRRKAVDLIKRGSVTVNGHLITEPGHKIAPKDVVKVDNKIIKQEAKTYILLNKPRGYVTATAGQEGRKTVMDLIAGEIRGRVYPIGSLDTVATGLLVMTNDGELIQQLSRSGKKVKEVYHITLNSPLKDIDIAEIKRGIMLSDGKVEIKSIRRVQDNAALVSMEKVRHRVILRLFESLGYLIKRLNRLEYAGLTSKGLPVNEWRFLTVAEVRALKAIAQKSAVKPSEQS